MLIYTITLHQPDPNCPLPLYFHAYTEPSLRHSLPPFSLPPNQILHSVPNAVLLRKVNSLLSYPCKHHYLASAYIYSQLSTKHTVRFIHNALHHPLISANNTIIFQIGLPPRTTPCSSLSALHLSPPLWLSFLSYD